MNCHPERAKRVEGSAHFVLICSRFSAKIPRLRFANIIVGLPPAILKIENRLRYARDDSIISTFQLLIGIVNCQL